MASESLTQRVSRLVPCLGWSEDLRRESGGCGGKRCVICWGRRPLGGSTSLGACTSLLPCDLGRVSAPEPGLCQALGSVRPAQALWGIVTVVLFFPDPRQGVTNSFSVTETGMEPAAGLKVGRGRSHSSGNRICSAPVASNLGCTEEMDFIRKRAERLG